MLFKDVEELNACAPIDSQKTQPFIAPSEAQEEGEESAREEVRLSTADAGDSDCISCLEDQKASSSEQVDSAGPTDCQQVVGQKFSSRAIPIDGMVISPVVNIGLLPFWGMCTRQSLHSPAVRMCRSLSDQATN